MSAEFEALNTAAAAFEADPSDSALTQLLAAEETHSAALKIARALWDDTPYNHAKGVAEDNANEMMWHEKIFPQDDKIEWYRMAYASLDFV